MVFIKLPVADAWCVRTPRVVRFLQPEYVDAFFERGELRLSCFAEFSRHADESRGDTQEGFHAARGPIDGGGVFSSLLVFGSQALVLSFTANDDAATAQEICGEYTSGIIVNDTTRFGTAVAMSLPDLVRGFEGACVYRQTPAQLTVPNWGSDIAPEELPKLLHRIQEQYSNEGYFIKRSKFKTQFEYRMIWAVIEPVESARMILCPEAIQFCSRWVDPRLDPFTSSQPSSPSGGV